jgi:SpoVK/Ycf46/Vps4 family AAA+-type ATPase
MYINADDKVVVLDDVNFLFDFQYIARDIFAQLSSGKHPLITLGLIQPYGAEMARQDLFELGRVATEEVLAELNITTKKQNIMQSLVSHKDITPKQLFYNQSEETQITQLETLLQPVRFEQVCDKLTAKGMRRGFACLFYGAPGTGKTETVLQLARKTGRDILQVNVSELRDKYVGESEKHVKALFDNYRKTVASSKIAPILLFNEADAIISKRTENIDRSVDKMENALQNIILQEIETLEGILIATTNLTANMDKAFERRFLYKVEFNAPTTEAKCAIWKSMIPSLSDEDARLLATEYKFSGGQIENIARKHTIAQILTESDITLNDIRLICNEELLDKSHTCRPIGF